MTMGEQQINNDITGESEESVSAQLSPEDIARVEEYLSSSIHSVDRKPFKPFVMMLGLVGVVATLSLLSWLISWLVLA